MAESAALLTVDAPINHRVPGVEDAHKANIDKIGAGPIVDPSPIDSMWLVPFALLFSPLLISMGIAAGLCKCLFVIANNIQMRSFLISCSCLCFSGSQPIWSYAFWVQGAVGTLLVLMLRSGRLGLFQFYEEVLGRGNKHWWAMSGIMTHRYLDVWDTLKEFQVRGPFFGGNKAARPGIWPPGDNKPGHGGSFLLWISGDKHTSYRRALHAIVIGKFELIKQRFKMLQNYLHPYLPSTPKDPAEFLALLQNESTMTELVSRTVWFIVFGVQLDEEELGWAAEWGSSAAFFILPQFVQNLLLRSLERSVKKMRRNMVTIMCRRPGVVKLFAEFKGLMNTKGVGGEDYSELPVETFMDEIQFVVNFAGLLGTRQLLESTIYALNRQVNPNFVKDGEIIFPETLTNKEGKSVSYVEAYNEDPIAFLKEVARLDPPVTSANSLTQQSLTIDMPSCFGGKIDIPVNSGNQYLISLAVRDEARFSDAKEFNPYRANIDDVLSWNATFPFPEENAGRKYDPMAVATYDPNGNVKDPLPLTWRQKNNWNRVCPGRNIALQTCVMILGMCPALNNSELTIKWTN